MDSREGNADFIILKTKKEDNEEGETDFRLLEDSFKGNVSPVLIRVYVMTVQKNSQKEGHLDV